MRWGLFTTLLALLLFATGCTDSSPYQWSLPPHVSPPPAPPDNPMTQAKVTLGRKLFYDKRLSGNQTYSCASCHLQKLAFTDGRSQAIGSTGEIHPRNSMTLANVGYRRPLTWANPLINSLEQHAIIPMFGEFPVEMGMVGKEQLLLQRLRSSKVCEANFAAAFPTHSLAISIETIVKALAAFMRTMNSFESPYDKQTLSSSAQAGMKLFFSSRLKCFRCHGGIHFNQPHDANNKPLPNASVFVNTGLYKGSYPKGGHGLYEISNKPEDMGRFKIPTLRNIEVTGPYMHDGSIKTLQDVLTHYASGGKKHRYQSKLLTGFTITPQERSQLLAFLHSLTDRSFLTNPKLGPPR